jgi:hypothetical protein
VPYALVSLPQFEFLPTPKANGRGSVWVNLYACAPNLLFLACSAASLCVWLLGVARGNLHNVTVERALGYGFTIFWLVTTAMSVAILPLEAVRGFGKEASRTYEEFAVTLPPAPAAEEEEHCQERQPEETGREVVAVVKSPSVDKGHEREEEGKQEHGAAADALAMQIVVEAY